MKKVKRTLLIITVFSFLLFPMLTQAKYQVTQPIPLGINSLDKMKPNGEFDVYVFRNDDWQKIGDLTFDRFFRERKIDLSPYLSGTEAVKIRLLEVGGGAAHIDAVFLGEISPAEVKGIQDSRFALKKLSRKDYDVIDAYGKNIEVIFSAKGKDNILKLTARVEGERIDDVPFQFPLTNLFKKMNGHSAFYSYTIGSENESSNPFFTEYSLTGSGHPCGFTYGWVSNDTENLYVRIDFTPDNTMDGNKDYAKVYVKTENGLKGFKVSVPENKWGNPDFIYTDKVAYQHKVYDFRIPFTELGIDNVKDTKQLLLAFAAYGTAAPGDFSSDLAYDPSNNRYLAVFTKVSTDYDFDIYGQLINCDGTPAGPEFVVFDSDSYIFGSKVAYDSDNHRFLVVWDYNTDVYGQIVNANGTLSGGNITISNADNSQESSDVTYDNVNDRFLVVWIDRRNYGDTWTDVYGQLVNANGSLSGSNFIICDNEDFQHSCSVAFDGTYQRFLVSWEDLRNGPERDIYARLVNANGTLYGSSDFVICDEATQQQWSPQVSNDSTSDRFLVVWGDDRNASYLISDIYGQLVNANNGSLNGSNFVISDASNAQISPEAVFDEANDRFLVVWHDDRDSSAYSDIYGQFVGASGSLAGSNFEVADASDSGYNYPQIDYNSNFENFLVLYNTHADSVFDFAFTRIGPPCEDEVASIPTITEWGMIILSLLLAGIALWFIKQRKRTS